MKVILLKDVEHLGSMGNEVIVKSGYARNYLVPRNLAILSTKGALRILEQKKKEKERQNKKIKEECIALAEKIGKVSCTIHVEVGEENKLFGSVTSEMISKELESEGIEIDKRKITLDEPIKALGVYSVEIRLHPDVKAQLRVWVVKK